MAIDKADKVSQRVFISRDDNRELIIEELKKYLELENVDLTKSSFLSFIVEALATLTSNLIFYQASAYREFFLTKAQLPDSIYNLAAFLGYEAQLAKYANANVLFEMPFGFADAYTKFTIPEGFKLYATGGVEFVTYYTTTIEVVNNSSVTITLQEGTKVINVPVVIKDSSFSFVLNTKQLSYDIQEFVVPADLQMYQFYELNVPLNGKVAEVVVEVREPGQTGYDLYSSFSSLYLMDSNDKGYVLRRTDAGLSISFGNGIIGYQPPAGSNVKVTLILTQGDDGNVIAGSIKTADRIYNRTDTGATELIYYTVVNPAGAMGGKDEEGIEEVRRNAIINISALERTVSENDYIHSNIIIDNSPIGPNSLPVLKRSDVKVNEIELFITLFYQKFVVPTRNAFTRFPPGTTVVPRRTPINIEGVDFYTIFDMVIEELNSVADYSYVLDEIQQAPILITSFNSDYSIYADNLVAYTHGTHSATFELRYNSTASDFDQVTAEMEILENGAIYPMVNDATAHNFVYVMPDYTALPEGELTYYFTLRHPTEGLVGRYQNTFIMRQSLTEFTRSNAFTDSTGIMVYDIPVIEKNYYDNIDQHEFEAQVLQSLLTSFTFADYKMMTDFVNLKFGNTTGHLQNMQLNDVNIKPVIGFISEPPPACMLGERYIILNGVMEFEGHDNEIVECVLPIDATAVQWHFTMPNTDDMVYVENKEQKYIYGGSVGWVLPNYMIPLTVRLDVFQTKEYTGSISDLSESVKDALMEAFTDRFGIEIELYRSEIIDVVQEVPGVEHCRLIKPQSNIFFNFDLIDLTQQELLEYGPEYVYFTKDTIEIKIFK